MRCSLCGFDSPGPSCSACGASPTSSDPAGAAAALLTLAADPEGAVTDLATLAADPDATRLSQEPVTPGGGMPGRKGMLVPGQAFGARYRVVRLLGAGGMGAVYQAWDAELGVTVALKTIRPGSDLALAASLEQRFKRELLLAREVTHKNVVRIHDLGEIDGTKYITMSYVDGRSLSALLHERGRLPVPEALGIARQIASGMQAAHEAGVVHRDLKPANVMVDQGGHALILDFGIARLERGGHQETAAGSPGVVPAGSSGWMTEGTLSGTVIGTLEYMAPEQAHAGDVDCRADIYAFGLILRDLLVGLRQTGPPLEALQERIEKGLPPLSSVDASLPDTLDAIVWKCTQIDPAARYQTMDELCGVLGRLDDTGQLLPEPKRITWRVVAAGVVLAAGLTGGAAWLLRPVPPPAAHAPVSVLVADFDNRTPDSVFSGAVEQAMAVGLEGASFVMVYPQRDARELIAQLAPGSGGRITVETGQLVARREGIKVLVAGTIEADPRGYRIATRLLDPADGKAIASAERRAGSKADVLKAVVRLAEDARVALGDSKSEMGKTETFTASSLGAVQEYTIAQALQDNYKDDEAVIHYEQATREDASFGRAYAGWAYSAMRLGRTQQSGDLWKKALSLIERMTEREKYRTLGLYYGTVTRDYEKAIDNYATLVRLFPADDAGHNNLALAYFSTRNFEKALEQGRMTLELYPRQPLYQNNAALFAMYASDFAAAAAEATRVTKAHPDYYPAYLPLAITALADGKPDAAREFYDRMAKTGASGASIASTGLADIALFQGQYAEAARILDAGIIEDGKAQNQAAVAAKYVALAEAHSHARRKADALRAVRKALEISRSEEVAVPSAIVLISAGAVPEAEALARELGGQLEPHRRAYGKLIEAELALSRGQLVEASEALRVAQKLADLWLGRFMMGRLYVEASRHAEAVSEFELARKRRGEATAVFLDDLPTYRYLATLPYWLGRAQEGLGLSSAAQANYKSFIDARPVADKDPVVADARRRVGSR